MINRYYNTSLQTLPKYNGQNVCDYDQKCDFTINKGIMTMKFSRDFLNNAMNLKNDQGHIGLLEMILDVIVW